ncbi:DUF916 domain-containing protein [Sediminihabitans luteus]|nr:DUF916 domain-containing protein [Sediminihabitans luteus]
MPHLWMPHLRMPHLRMPHVGTALVRTPRAALVAAIAGVLLVLVAPGPASAVPAPASDLAATEVDATVVAATDPDATDPDATATHVTWGVRTASGDLGADRQNYTHELDPGESVTDAVVVTNHDDTPLDLDLYGADGFTTAAGQLDVAGPDVDPVGLAAWFTAATDHVTIEPGESLQVDFALTVPDDAQPGDYAGAVVTSLGSTDAAGVSVDRRLGVRIHLRVSGALTPALAVEDLAVTYDGTVNPFAPGVATVTYTVRNTGNARLAAGQDVRVGGPWGLASVQAEAADVPELLPGESWPVRVEVAGAWPLVRLGATVTLDPTLPGSEGAGSVGAGSDGAGSAGAGSDGARVADVVATASGWAVPWTVLLLVGGAVGALLLARRRRRLRGAAEEARVAAAVEEAVAALRATDATDDANPADANPADQGGPVPDVTVPDVTGSSDTAEHGVAVRS